MGSKRIVVACVVLVLFLIGTLIPGTLIVTPVTPDHQDGIVSHSRATTYIEDDINYTASWDGTVYIGASVTILAGYTITISPGTEVIFNASVSTGYGLTVEGTLVAVGSSSQRIVFKSDSYVVGDPDSSKHFKGILFTTPETAPVFKFCDFIFGATCIDTSKDIIAENCIFQDFKTYGILAKNGANVTGKLLDFGTNGSSTTAAIKSIGATTVTLDDIDYDGTERAIYLDTVETVAINGLRSGSSVDFLYTTSCGDVTINDAVVDFQDEICFEFDECGNILLSDLEITGGADSSSSYAFDAYDCISFKLHNSSINITSGYLGSISSVPELYLADLDLVMQDEYTCISANPSSKAVIRGIDIVTIEDNGLSLSGGGDCFINDITGTIKDGWSGGILVLGGSANYTVNNVVVDILIDGEGLYVSTTGDTTVKDLVVNCGEGSGVSDISTGTRIYNNIDLLGGTNTGMNIMYGDVTLDDIYIDQVSGTGIYFLYTESASLTNSVIMGPDISGLVATEAMVDIDNVVIITGYGAIQSSTSTVTISNSFIEAGIGSTAIMVTSGEVEVSSTIINNSIYGLQIYGDAPEVTCFNSEIRNTWYGIYVSSADPVMDIRSINIINFTWAGIYSDSASFTVDNVWFGHVAPFIQGSTVTTEAIDANNYVTLDEAVSGPLDIPGVEQDTSVHIEDDSPYDVYLTGVITFEGTVTDPDEEDTITDIRCRAYEEGRTPAAWDDVNLSNIAGRVKFEYEYDTTALTMGYLDVEVEVTLADNSVVILGWSYYVYNVDYEPPGDDDTGDDDITPAGGDGGGQDDADDNIIHARLVETNKLYNTNSLNSPSDVDWYKIEVKNLEYFIVEVTETSESWAEIYDSDHNLLGNATGDAGPLKINGPPDGNIYIMVAGSNYTKYAFHITSKEKVKEKTLAETIGDQPWFMLVLEFGLGVFLMLLLAVFGVFFASRNRRKVAKELNKVKDIYETNKATPAVAIQKLSQLHQTYEAEFTSGKLRENHYMLLDKKITDHLSALKVVETQNREGAIAQEEIPPKIKEEIKDALADGQVTPEEAEKIIEDVDATDIPEEVKEEVKDMVEGWEKEDEQMPGPPPPPPADPTQVDPPNSTPVDPPK